MAKFVQQFAKGERERALHAAALVEFEDVVVVEEKVAEGRKIAQTLHTRVDEARVPQVLQPHQPSHLPARGKKCLRMLIDRYSGYVLWTHGTRYSYACAFSVSALTLV